MKSILIGSVFSSEIVLEEMVRAKFPVSLVFSLDEKYSDNVSGYYPIHKTAEKYGIPYVTFQKIGNPDNVELIKEIEADYIFIIGLSQLVKKEILDAAKIGVIGFHPTPLPKLRGRAAMVWQVLLGIHDTKCTMFFLDEGMDSGDILDQEPYLIEDTDYAVDVEHKLGIALRRLTTRVLDGLRNRTIKPIKQNEEEATYLLVRRPEDGKINWQDPVEKIQRLIRAVSKPYPGAFGMYDGCHKIIIWKADYLANEKYIGIPGQIAQICENYFDVLGSDGLIRIYDFDNLDGVKLLVGHKL